MPPFCLENCHHKGLTMNTGQAQQALMFLLGFCWAPLNRKKAVALLCEEAQDTEQLAKGMQGDESLKSSPMLVKLAFAVKNVSCKLDFEIIG